MLLALDTETTGIDLYHGAQPYLVTACREDGTVLWWQWDVDPLTRRVQVPAEDVREVRQLLQQTDWSCFDAETAERHGLVAQNGKFDCAALNSIGVDNWPWEVCHDTLIASHLLASNQPHDLTSLALHYLGIDIQPYEDRLKEACLTARRLVRKHFPAWRLAKSGEPDMPSVKSGSDRTERGGESEKAWKADAWLPRQLAQELGLDEYPDDHPWHTVLKDYANADSAVTLALWKVLRDELKRRGLWQLYQERRKLMHLAYRMEARGLTLSGSRLGSLEQEFAEESVGLSNVCVHLAEGQGYELKLPKSGRNNSLNTFLFDVLKLPVLKHTDNGNPSMDKAVLEAWQLTLKRGTPQAAFINALVTKRKIDTALTYMDGYRRFSQPLGQDWFILHPFLNPCGTNTLRWSSANPNEQNISKQKGHNLRYCFGPAPGREWWSLDAKNLELRIPAYEANELDMIALFERPEQPPYYGSNHLLNFHTVYPDIWEQVQAEVGLDKVGPECKKRFESTWYQWCKNGGFAIQYGGGCVTADAAFHRPNCHRLLTQRFRKIHGLGGLNERMLAFSRRHGYVETIPDRSVDLRHGYPIMVTRTEWGEVLPTVPLNYHVQGTACWWMARAMVRCQEQLDLWQQESDGQWDGFMTIQVHDELVFDLPAAPNHGNRERIEVLKRLMEQGGADIGVPTPVSVELHTESWAEGVEW